MKHAVLTMFLLCGLIGCLFPASASAQTIPTWAVGVPYTVGSLVMYDGVEYEALQAETSEVGWEPSSTPALWEVVSSSCSTAPSAPSGLVASGTTSTGTTLSWTAPSTPTGCTVSYVVLKSGAAIATPSTTADSVTGLTASTAYSFAVEAVDAAGTSAASSAVSVTTSAASGGGGACSTAWSATETYTEGMTASLTGENYVANYWTQGQSPASNSGGSGTGEPWTATGSCSSCSTIPNPPTGLTSSGTTSSGTTLGWTAPSTPTACTVSYNVLKNGASIGTPTITSDTVTGLTASTAYSFAVESTDAAGTSAASTALSVTTTASSCTAVPSAPTGLTSSGTTSSGTTLSWTAPSSPTGCTLSYIVLQGATSIATPTTTSDTVTTLTPATTYSFTVEAVNSVGTSSASTAVSVTTSAASNLIVGGWFEEWSIYYAGYNIANLQTNGMANVLTHLIYAFADVTAPTSATASCEIADSYADYQDMGLPQVTGPYSGAGGVYGNFAAMQQLKAAHPNMKMIISLGGANAANFSAFESAASTAAGRTALASSCINMFIEGNIASGVTAPGLFDGINIDWEFPTPADTANFTALLTEFRNQLTALSATTGKTYSLSFDGPAGTSNADNPGGYDTIDIPGAFAEVDFATIDGYNYDGDWDLTTNDASPLYDDSTDPLNGTGNSIDATVQAYLATGIPASKYTMGFPAYGAGWTGNLTSANCGEYQTATEASPVPNANGVGTCSTGDNQSSPAAGCDTLLTDGLASYATIKNLLNNGYTACYDSTRVATSAFNPTTQTVYSYDDATSIAAKTAYIKANGLGGGYIWALKDDDSNGTLTKAIAAGLNP